MFGNKPRIGKGPLYSYNELLIMLCLSRSIGSYRGDKNKWFPTNCVRFLTQDELLYIKEVVSFGRVVLFIHFIC